MGIIIWTAKRLLLISMVFSIHASADKPKEYIVNSRQVLSQILFDLNIGPIYGPKGKLLEVLEQNPHIRSRDPAGNSLRPGDVIFISERAEEPVVSKSTIRNSTLETPESDISESSFGFLRIDQSFVRIDGSKNKQSGSLASSLVPGFTLGLTPFEDEKSRISFSFGYQRMHFLKPENYEIDENDFTLTSLSGTFEQEIVRYLSLTLGYAHQEHVFFSPRLDYRIDTEKIGLSQQNIGLTYQIHERISIMGLFRLHNSGGTSGNKIRQSEGFGGRAKFYSRKYKMISVEPYYTEDQFRGNRQNFKKKEIGVSFSYEF